MAIAQQNLLNPLHRVHTPPSPKEEIDRLHSGFQIALNDLSMTQLHDMTIVDKNGKKKIIKVAPTFGVSRVPSALILHNGVARDTHVGLGRPEVRFYALSNFGKPLSPDALTFHKDVGPYGGRADAHERNEIRAFAAKACVALKDKPSYQGRILSSYAEARPLVASKPECLPCHKASKVGDPLAILVFLVKESVKPK